MNIISRHINIWGLYIVLAMFFCACNTREALFDVNGRTDFRVELGMSIIATHNFVNANVSIPVNTSISNLGLNEEDIAEVLPLTAVLRPKFGDEINLDFINSVNVYIITDPAQQKRKELFYMDFVRPGEKTEIELLPTLVDISDLIENDQAIIEISIELRQFPPSSFDMRLQMQFSGFASE